MRSRIVKARRQSLDVHFLVGAFDIEFFDFRAAVKDLTANHRAVQVDPLLGAMFRLYQPLQMNLPRADEKIKVALPIVRGSFLRRRQAG